MSQNEQQLFDRILKGDQSAFDQLMRENSEFLKLVTNATAERMGTVPDQTVFSMPSDLDSKPKSILAKNQPPKIARFFRVVMKWLLVFAVLGFLGYSVHILWPKLLSIFPQIDLSASSSLGTQVPKYKLAPPAMIAPLSDYSDASVPVKTSPIKTPKVVVNTVVGKRRIVAPIASTVASDSGNNTQVDDSIRLAVNNDKTQTVVVTVLNHGGNLVRHLYQGLWASGSHFVDWNGKDDSGNSVTPGNYTIVVQEDDKKTSGIVTIKPN